MGTLLIIFQIVTAILLVLAVLLQPGNKGGVNAALGGSSSESVFGGQGASNFLSKLTFSIGLLFMIANIALSFMYTSRSSVLNELESLNKKKSLIIIPDINIKSNNKKIDKI